LSRLPGTKFKHLARFRIIISRINLDTFLSNVRDRDIKRYSRKISLFFHVYGNTEWQQKNRSKTDWSLSQQEEKYGFVTSHIEDKLSNKASYL